MARAPNPRPHTIDDLQRLLDRYRRYYNTHRRHSALPRRITPNQAWTTAPSLGGPASPPVQTDATLHRCPVTNTGAIAVGRPPHQRRHAPTPAPPSPPSATATASPSTPPTATPSATSTSTPTKNYITLTRPA